MLSQIFNDKTMQQLKDNLNYNKIILRHQYINIENNFVDIIKNINFDNNLIIINLDECYIGIQINNELDIKLFKFHFDCENFVCNPFINCLMIYDENHLHITPTIKNNDIENFGMYKTFIYLNDKHYKLINCIEIFEFESNDTIDNLLLYIDKTDEEITEIREKIKRKTEKLKILEELNEEIEIRDKKIEILEEIINVYENEVVPEKNALIRIMDKKNEDIHTLKNKLKDKDKEIEKLKEIINKQDEKIELKNEIEKLNEIVNEKDKEINEIKDELINIKTNIKQLLKN